MLNGRIQIAVLCSSRAPGLDALLRHPSHGLSFDIRCVITSASSFRSLDVPVIAHPIRTFYGRTPISDRATRRRYDAQTTEYLKLFEADLVITLGYLYVITEPLLDAFPNRIFNVHDSDVPKYPGLHATRDAIVAGERQTFTSVHIVTPDLDQGPVIARSEPFQVAPFAHAAALAGCDDIVRAYAYAHREWMMRAGWGDLVVFALEQLAVTEAFA